MFILSKYAELSALGQFCSTAALNILAKAERRDTGTSGFPEVLPPCIQHRGVLSCNRRKHQAAYGAGAELRVLNTSHALHTGRISSCDLFTT